MHIHCPSSPLSVCHGHPLTLYCPGLSVVYSHCPATTLVSLSCVPTVPWPPGLSIMCTHCPTFWASVPCIPTVLSHWLIHVYSLFIHSLSNALIWDTESWRFVHLFSSCCIHFLWDFLYHCSLKHHLFADNPWIPSWTQHLLGSAGSRPPCQLCISKWLLLDTQACQAKSTLALYSVLLGTGFHAILPVSVGSILVPCIWYLALPWLPFSHMSHWFFFFTINTFKWHPLLTTPPAATWSKLRVFFSN